MHPTSSARLRALVGALTLVLATLGFAGVASAEAGPQGAETATDTATAENTPERNDTMSRPRVQIETSKGPITIELYADEAPKSTENFLSYVRSGHYDGTIFHRVIPGFMVQGGGFNPDMSQKETGDPVPNEADNGVKNKRGTLAMARTMNPHSASAQFFVNVTDNTFLDHTGKNPQGWGYAVFGEVVDGMDVVDAIVAVPTGNRGGHQNVPTEPVMLESAKVVEAGE